MPSYSISRLQEQSKYPCYKASRGIRTFGRFFIYMAPLGQSLGRWKASLFSFHEQGGEQFGHTPTRRMRHTRLHPLERRRLRERNFGYDPGAPLRGLRGAHHSSCRHCDYRGQRRFGAECVRQAEKNHRWLNFTVKAFGDMCERVKRMKLKEGSYINIIARYDEETWETKDTHETRTGVVLYLDEIEYASSGNGQKNGQTSSDGTAPQGGGAPAPQSGAPAPQSQPQGHPQGQTPPAPDPMPGGFTGYESFGDAGNPFF